MFISSAGSKPFYSAITIKWPSTLLLCIMNVFLRNLHKIRIAVTNKSLNKHTIVTKEHSTSEEPKTIYIQHARNHICITFVEIILSKKYVFCCRQGKPSGFYQGTRVIFLTTGVTK